MTTDIAKAGASTSLMHADLHTLVPVPALCTETHDGHGLAVCPVLGLLVISELNPETLVVYTLPRVYTGVEPETGTAARSSAHSPPGLKIVCTLGGRFSAAPMQFGFHGSEYNGALALTDSSASNLLLVCDQGNAAVHVVDVVGRSHVGYVAGPGTILKAKAVASRGSLVAVGARKGPDSWASAIFLFSGSGATWTTIRVVDGYTAFAPPLHRPEVCPICTPLVDSWLISLPRLEYDATVSICGSDPFQAHYPHAIGLSANMFGLRFTRDGTRLAVTSSCNNDLSVIRVQDGVVEGNLARGLGIAWDMEEVQGGWLVACIDSSVVKFVPTEAGLDQKTLGGFGTEDGQFSHVAALALVPGLGLVTRDFSNGNRVQVFVYPEPAAMAAMSRIRVAWMVGVARGTAFRVAKLGKASTAAAVAEA
jgi:hypothetical protein